MKNSVVIAAVMILCGVSFGGLTYSGATEYSVGSGSNTAYVAVDFDYGTSFVFEYKWNGVATGYDAIAAIADAGALDITIKTFSFGPMVTDLVYPGGVKISYTDPYAGWAYFNSANGESWSSSGVGAAGRSLSNGVWDSWVWTDWAPDYSASRQPGSNPIPEPATMAMLGLGIIFATRKK